MTKTDACRCTGIFMACCSMGLGCHDSQKNADEDAKPSTMHSNTHSPEQSTNSRNADVCHFTDEVKIGPVEADGMISIPANHPDIFYMGRVDCSNPSAPSFAFPGVSIRVRFEGDAIDMKLRDHGTKELANYYNIIIDDQEPTVLQVSPQVETYELARGLSDGEHTLEIFKRVESSPSDTPNAGKGALLGLRIRGGKRLLKMAPRPLRMEFIGDSITCGYGNGVATDSPDDFPYTTKNANAYKAFGAIVARTLNAEYMPVAFSGRGIVRNYDDYEGDTMPQMYLRTLPDDDASAPWDVSRFTPDIVVINLGTNDFSEGLEKEVDTALPRLREQFRWDYILFLETLRGYYPGAVFIIALGPMLNDSWPNGYKALTSIQEDIDHIIEARKDRGDKEIHLLLHSQQKAPYGEDWHPSADTHEQMAKETIAFINALDILHPHP